MRRHPFVRLALAATIATGAALTAVAAAPSVSGAAKPVKAAPLYDISIGDSYSVGYQNPSLLNSSGFTGYVAKKEKMTLLNFGCSGATTTSIFTQTGCPTADSAPATSGGVAYDSTDQVDAVLYFINEPANYGKVGLVTVSIGGNDVTACANDANPIPCVAAANTSIATNVGNLVSELDSALTANGDTTAHIAGITYPDVILGDDVTGPPPTATPNPSLAVLSKAAFDIFINPTLDTAYTSVTRGLFVNVTTAPYKFATAGDDTGSFDGTTYAYTGPTKTIPGLVKNAPAPVAEVCDLTWYCQSATFGDIHANTKGYNFIGSLVVAKLGTL